MFLTLREIRRLIREVTYGVLGQPVTGWWVMQDGTIEQVERGYEHSEVAAMLLGMKDPSTNDLQIAYDHMYNKGAAAIRCWSPDDCSVTVRTLDQGTLERLQSAFEQVMPDKVRARVTLHTLLPVKNVLGGTSFSGSVLKLRLGDILSARNVKDVVEFGGGARNVHETFVVFGKNTGWWILKDGTIIPLAADEEHAEAAGKHTGAIPKDTKVGLDDLSTNDYESCQQAFEQLFLNGGITVRLFTPETITLNVRRLDESTLERIQSRLGQLFPNRLKAWVNVQIDQGPYGGLLLKLGDLLSAGNVKEALALNAE